MKERGVSINAIRVRKHGLRARNETEENSIEVSIKESAERMNRPERRT